MGDSSCLASPESRMGREERGAGGWGRKILTCALVGAAALPSVQGFATPCGALRRGQLGLSAQPAWHLTAPKASGLAGRELSRALPGRVHRQGARGFQSPVAAFECNGAGGSSKAMSVVEEYGGKLIRIDNEDSWNKLLAAHEEAGAVLVAEFRAAMCRKVTSPPLHRGLSVGGMLHCHTSHSGTAALGNAPILRHISARPPAVTWGCFWVLHLKSRWSFR